MTPHTSNCLFILCYFLNKTLPFQHVFVPLVEEESVYIMPDESNVSGSDLEVEYLICISCINTHRKLPDINSIWEFYAIELKGYTSEGRYW